MRKLFYAIIAVTAFLAVACDKTESVKTEPEVFEVKIGLSGAITSEITELTKSLPEGMAIGIDVWACPEAATSYSPYAYGVFNTDDITIQLISGYKYKFTARYGDKSKAQACFYKIVRTSGANNAGSYGDIDNCFHFASDTFLGDFSWQNGLETDLFYGETIGYIPTTNGVVSIDLVRVSFGLSITANNINSGSVVVSISNMNGRSITLSDPDYSFNSVFVMNYFAKSYAQESYSESLDVTAVLIDANNASIPLGTATISVMRNKLTKVLIDASTPRQGNGIVLNYSDEEMTDDPEDTYTIGG